MKQNEKYVSLEKKIFKASHISDISCGIAILMYTVFIMNLNFATHYPLIIVVIAMDGKTGQILAGPDVISRGFVYVRESEDLMESIRNQISKDISSMEEAGIKDWATIKSRVRDTLHDYIYSKTKRNPMIIPIISEIEK